MPTVIVPSETRLRCRSTWHREMVHAVVLVFVVEVSVGLKYSADQLDGSSVTVATVPPVCVFHEASALVTGGGFPTVLVRYVKFSARTFVATVPAVPPL